MIHRIEHPGFGARAASHLAKTLIEKPHHASLLVSAQERASKSSECEKNTLHSTTFNGFCSTSLNGIQPRLAYWSLHSQRRFSTAVRPPVQQHLAQMMHRLERKSRNPSAVHRAHVSGSSQVHDTSNGQIRVCFVPANERCVRW